MSEEIMNHTQGIWRSFILYTKEPIYVLDYLERHHIRHSWQRYFKMSTPHHISVRVDFDSDEDLTAFRIFLDDRPYVWEERSWDEKEVTKRAYEFGSHIHRIYRDIYSANKNINKDKLSFIANAFHGFFNELDMDYWDEAYFYVLTLANVFPHVPSLARYLQYRESQVNGGKKE